MKPVKRLGDIWLRPGVEGWAKALIVSMLITPVFSVYFYWQEAQQVLLALNGWQQGLVNFLIIWPWSVFFGMLVFGIYQRFQLRFFGQLLVAVGVGSSVGFTVGVVEGFTNKPMMPGIGFPLVLSVLAFSHALKPAKAVTQQPVWFLAAMAIWPRVLGLSLLWHIGLAIFLAATLDAVIHWPLSMLVAWPWSIVIAILSFRATVALNDRWFVLPISLFLFATSLAAVFIDSLVGFADVLLIMLLAGIWVKATLEQAWRKAKAAT
ncbi:hypothetical protein [Salinibius halmophilus]|uniref:hypothetical protein n=1 Tax=Salinibius halmophilus TaxID=1853216 RepID=UPI000E661FFA|nr:hypothetical protein [Salinibius halmophilus]